MPHQWANSYSALNRSRPRRATCSKMGAAYLVSFKGFNFLLRETDGKWQIHMQGHGKIAELELCEYGKESAIDWIESNC